VHDRVSRHGPARRRLLDTALHGRDVLPRNHAAHDLVHELQARPAGKWGDPDPAVAVLAAAPRLLLVLALPFSFSLERLAVRDLRLTALGVHADLAGQPAHGH